MVLERVGEEPGDWYIQVWRRPEGAFQLEYRAGVEAPPRAPAGDRDGITFDQTSGSYRISRTS